MTLEELALFQAMVARDNQLPQLAEYGMHCTVGQGVIGEQFWGWAPRELMGKRCYTHYDNHHGGQSKLADIVRRLHQAGFAAAATWVPGEPFDVRCIVVAISADMLDVMEDRRIIESMIDSWLRIDTDARMSRLS
jgi:hypothetical protein